MNVFLLSPSQRILEWRKFRQNLNEFEEFQQLTETCKFWAQAPLQTYVLDWDQGSEWPTAWQLIHEGNFDTIVVSLLMEQTLILAGWNSSRLKLIFLKNTVIEDQMMILVVDNKWALNYSYGEVFDYTKIECDCTALVRYQVQNGIRLQITE
jgi:hypothetical protein